MRMKALKIIITTSLLIFFYFFGCWLWEVTEPGPAVYNQAYTTPEERMAFDKAFRQHGILVAYQNKDGIWVFERDGKVCKLLKSEAGSRG